MLTKEQREARKWIRDFQANRRKEWRHVVKVKGEGRRFPIFGNNILDKSRKLG